MISVCILLPCTDFHSLYLFFSSLSSTSHPCPPPPPPPPPHTHTLPLNLYLKAPLASAMLACLVPFFEPVFSAVSALPLDGLVSYHGFMCPLTLPHVVWYVSVCMTAAGGHWVWCGGCDGQPLHLHGHWQDFSDNVSFYLMQNVFLLLLLLPHHFISIFSSYCLASLFYLPHLLCKTFPHHLVVLFPPSHHHVSISPSSTLQYR